MITATYIYPKDLIVRAHMVQARHGQLLPAYFMHHFVRFAAVGILIMVTDTVYGNGMKPTAMVFPVLICAVFCAWSSRRKWLAEIRAGAQDLEVEIEADDSGLRSRWMEIEKRLDWDHYLWWVKETDTVILRHRNGASSFVPKTPETVDVIAFMKTKVKGKPSTD